MKKLVFAFFALFMLASCSEDNDNNVNQGPKKYVSAMTFGQGEFTSVTTFEYDEDKNIKTVIDDNETYKLAYSEGNLVSIKSVINGHESSFYDFIYENGELTAYHNLNGTFPIVHNEQAGSYLLNNKFELMLDGGDIGRIIRIGSGSVLDVEFDNVKKGPFYNVPAKNMFLIIFFLNMHYYGSIKPMKTWNDPEGFYTAENIFDADGYITSSSMTSDGAGSGYVSYQYSEL